MSEGVDARVIRYMADHVGLDVFVSDIVKDTELTERQIISAMSHLRAKGYRVLSVMRGVYRYDGTTEKKDGGILYEQIGVAKDNRIVLQDEAGDIYLATKL